MDWIELDWIGNFFMLSNAVVSNGALVGGVFTGLDSRLKIKDSFLVGLVGWDGMGLLCGV